MARKRGTAMYSLMAAKVLFAKEASAAVADVTLSRWGGHLLRLLVSPTSHPKVDSLATSLRSTIWYAMGFAGGSR